MFKRKAVEKSKPLENLMLQVQEYVASVEGGEIDTVVGVDLDGKKFSVILTTTGEAAEKDNRNTIASFAKEKSNHHVPVGGLMLLNTVWTRDGEKPEDPVSGVARWPEFFAHAREEMTIANAMYRAGTKVAEGGKENNWAVLERMGKPTALDAADFNGFVAAFADKCVKDVSRAMPIVRLMSEKGEVIDYTTVKQDFVTEDGKRRAQSGDEVVGALAANKRLTKMLADAAAGKGTLEVIPVMSVSLSPKMMNSPRGKNFIALAKKFSNAEQTFAAECYVRRAPTDEYNYISHLAVTDKPRFDPLLIPSETFATPAYSEQLLADLGVAGKAPAAAAPAPAPEHEQEEPAYDDAPGFGD
jgi:hypothetical protein